MHHMSILVGSGTDDQPLTLRRLEATVDFEMVVVFGSRYLSVAEIETYECSQGRVDAVSVERKGNFAFEP